MSQKFIKSQKVSSDDRDWTCTKCKAVAVFQTKIYSETIDLLNLRCPILRRSIDFP